jgi:hypothetical protein
MNSVMVAVAARLAGGGTDTPVTVAGMTVRLKPTTAITQAQRLNLRHFGNYCRTYAFCPGFSFALRYRERVFLRDRFLVCASPWYATYRLFD